jgi:PilZ domain
MEQRREPRFEADQPVRLTVLGANGGLVQARVRNISGRGLGLETTVPIEPGAALKIEFADSIILAEAVFCRGDGDRDGDRDGDKFFVGVALEQVLTGLAELGKILQQYQDERSEVRL